MNFFLLYSAILLAGIMLGICATLVYQYPFEVEMNVLLDQVGERDSTELLNYLEKSECNLFYNSTINAWGLVDGQDKLIAAGHSIRATLRRAQAGDLAQRVAADFTNAELDHAQSARAQAAINSVAKE